MKKMLLTVLVLGLAGGLLGPAQADEKKETFLGLGVEPLSQALHSQLPGILPKGQGVLVHRVVTDSPAAKAGLQPFDILLNYGDQKLYSPEQLVKIVRGDKPGHEVALGFVRAGKPMACKVKLGESAPPMVPDTSRVFRLLPDDGLQNVFKELEGKNDKSAWESFDAMKLTRVDANHWRAEIEYRAKEGKKDVKSYTGTREEIQKAIQAEKDLPVNERNHLLRALNLRPAVFEFHFPPLDSITPELWERP